MLFACVDWLKGFSRPQSSAPARLVRAASALPIGLVSSVSAQSATYD